MRGDWTRRDEKILNFIKSYDRLGIPVNIIYGPNNKGCYFPEILTKQTVINNINKVKKMKIKVDDCFPDVTFFQLVDGNPKTFKSSAIFNEKK